MGDIRGMASSHELEIHLKDYFKWFLGKDFAQLREGFIPTDNSEFLKERDERAIEIEKSLKEKIPLSQTEPEAEPNPSILQEMSKMWRERGGILHGIT
jgi:hypothetical protein